MTEVVVWLEARGGAPEWIRMLPRGKVELADGRPPILVDDEALKHVLERFAARGNDLVVDYEHQTLEGGQAPAAGWIKAMEAREDGLWVRVEWTDKAQSFIDAREYRYFSPVVQLDKERRVQELLHAGLTNNPAMANLMPLAATFRGAGTETEDHNTGNTGGKGMIEKLRAILGLPDEAGEVEALNMLAGLQAALTAWGEVAEAAGLQPGAGAGQVTAAVLALKQGQDALGQVQQELAELKTTLAAKDAAQAVEAALAAGKLLPGQRDWALEYAAKDPEAFKIFVEKTPVVVPLGRLPRRAEGPPENGGELDQEALAMCRLTGADPEKFKAQRAKEQGGTE